MVQQTGQQRAPRRALPMAWLKARQMVPKTARQRAWQMELWLGLRMVWWLVQLMALLTVQQRAWQMVQQRVWQMALLTELLRAWLRDRWTERLKVLLTAQRTVWQMEPQRARQMVLLKAWRMVPQTA